MENYKREVRCIYFEGVVQPEFAEARHKNTNSGFRGLLNEVSIIADTRLIPVGDIFL
jgi:hypothetical protein